jgi:hypothetical protein
MTRISGRLLGVSLLAVAAISLFNLLYLSGSNASAHTSSPITNPKHLSKSSWIKPSKLSRSSSLAPYEAES